MTRRSLSALAFACALVSLVVVAHAQAPRGWQSITGTGWSFAVPPRWENLQPPPSSQPSAMIVSSVGAPPSARGRFPNVNLVVERFGGNNPTAYGQAAVAAVSQVATVVASGAASGAGRPAFDIEAEWPNNQPPTHSLQRIRVASGNAYVITCSDTVAAWGRSAATCQRILASFDVR